MLTIHSGTAEPICRSSGGRAATAGAKCRAWGVSHHWRRRSDAPTTTIFGRDAADDRRAGRSRPEWSERRPCCPSGVCRQSIARRASVFRGCSEQYGSPGGLYRSRGGGAPFSRGVNSDAGRVAGTDCHATYRPRTGVTRRLLRARPLRNHPSEIFSHPSSRIALSPPRHARPLPRHRSSITTTVRINAPFACSSTTTAANQPHHARATAPPATVILIRSS